MCVLFFEIAGTVHICHMSYSLVVLTLAGLSSGHVPGAISVPFSDLVDPVTKKLRSGKELREILLRKGVDPSEGVEKKLMCGTGVTAVVIETALDLAGIPGKRVVYDGSWT